MTDTAQNHTPHNLHNCSSRHTFHGIFRNAKLPHSPHPALLSNSVEARTCTLHAAAHSSRESRMQRVPCSHSSAKAASLPPAWRHHYTSGKGAVRPSSLIPCRIRFIWPTFVIPRSYNTKRRPSPFTRKQECLGSFFFFYLDSSGGPRQMTPLLRKANVKAEYP